MQPTSNPVDLDVCLLGPRIEHRDSLMAMLAGRARSVEWIPDSHTFLQINNRAARSSLGRTQDALLGTRDPAFISHALELFDRQGTNVVVAYWGTIPLGDIIALKKARPRIRFVLMLLCYPLSLHLPGIIRQRLALSWAWSSLDGVLCPTQEMLDYLLARGVPRLPLMGVLRPAWPMAFHVVERPAALSDEPNIIYCGRTDISGRTAHAADDLRALMNEMLEAKIHLHHGHSPETADGHPYRHAFKVQPVRQLITWIAGHDASLIAYNLDACKRVDRFDLTVPDRLISSVAGGIPLAIPRKGYQASKTYLKDYGAVIEFDSATDLHRQLRSRERVAELKDQAWRAREAYTAEAQGPVLATALGGLLSLT